MKSLFNSVDELRDMLLAPKRLIKPHGWKTKRAMLVMASAIEIDGIGAQGIEFLASCNSEREEEQVSFILLASIGLKLMPFARVDWRGQPHSNKEGATEEHRFKDAGRTHFHDTELHMHFNFSKLFNGKNNLPVAREITPEPSNFAELLEKAGELLHIENLSEIETPPWAPRTSFI